MANKKKTSKSRRLVLGLDSSTTCFGYAFIDISKGGLKLVDYGKIIPPLDPEKVKIRPALTNKKLDYLPRCNYILKEIEKIYESAPGKVIAVAIEQPNSFKNGETTRQLCGLYGMVRYIYWVRYNINCAEMNTGHVKRCITGNGNAGKQEMVDAINDRFNIELIYKDTQNKEKTDDDIADAISVAATYVEENE